MKDQPFDLCRSHWVIPADHLVQSACLADCRSTNRYNTVRVPRCRGRIIGQKDVTNGLVVGVVDPRALLLNDTHSFSTFFLFRRWPPSRIMLLNERGLTLLKRRRITRVLLVLRASTYRWILRDGYLVLSWLSLRVLLLFITHADFDMVFWLIVAILFRYH